MAERAEKMLPPELKDEDDQQADPEKQMLVAQNAELQQALAQASQEQNTKAAELQIKAQSEAAGAQNDRMKLDLDAMGLRLKELETASAIEFNRRQAPERLPHDL